MRRVGLEYNVLLKTKEIGHFVWDIIVVVSSLGLSPLECFYQFPHK